MNTSSFPEVTDSQKKEYETNGFVIVRDLIDRSLCNELYNSIVRLAIKYDDTIDSALLDSDPWQDPSFHASLIQLREQSPDFFGGLYDSVQLGVLSKQVTCTPKITSFISQLLGEPLGGISMIGHQVRMDPPDDRRNALGWHQESSYYKQTLIGDHTCVVWFPLHDHRAEHGPVEVCVGSHKTGQLEVEATKDKDYGTSEQLEVPSSVVETFDQQAVVINQGDAVVFHSNLFHRSGNNTSKEIRFCAAARFHRMLPADFLPGRESFKPNQSVGRLSGD